MKNRILMLICLLFAFGMSIELAMCQKLANKKSITIVWSNSKDGCGKKALKIIGDSVLIDTCYDITKKVFTTP